MTVETAKLSAVLPGKRGQICDFAALVWYP